MRIKKGHIKLSQSEIKGLGIRICNGEISDYDHCPALFKHKVIDGNYPLSKPMKTGVVLESNLIGASRGETIMKLDKIGKNKDKVSVPMQRILKHKEHFEEFCEKHNIYVGEYNVQMPIACSFGMVENEHVTLTGVTDIFPASYANETCIIDIKYYTGSIDKMAFFNHNYPITHDSCYENDEKFNTLQAAMYRYIVKHTNYEWLTRFWKLNDCYDSFFPLVTEERLKTLQQHYLHFHWFIFSLSPLENPSEQYHIKSYIPMDGEIQTLKNAIILAAERFLQWEREGFKEKYIDRDCVKCPLKENCETYLKVKS